MTPDEVRTHIQLEREAREAEDEALDQMVEREIKQGTAAIANIAALQELGGSDPLQALTYLTKALIENPTEAEAVQ
jgi:hypothetical protein